MHIYYKIMNMRTKMKHIITHKLTAAFAPSELVVENESAKHAGHAGHREAGGGENTHFRVRITSAAFAGVPRVRQHRMIYDALAEEMKTIHALQLEVSS